MVYGELARWTTFQIGYVLRVGGDTRATAVTVHGVVNGAGGQPALPSGSATSAAADPGR